MLINWEFEIVIILKILEFGSSKIWIEELIFFDLEIIFFKVTLWRFKFNLEPIESIIIAPPKSFTTKWSKFE